MSLSCSPIKTIDVPPHPRFPDRKPFGYCAAKPDDTVRPGYIYKLPGGRPVHWHIVDKDHIFNRFKVSSIHATPEFSTVIFAKPAADTAPDTDPENTPTDVGLTPADILLLRETIDLRIKALHHSILLNYCAEADIKRLTATTEALKTLRAKLEN